MIYELTDHVVVAASPAETWAFFSRAENLPRITPASMAFKILTRTPIEMFAGTLIDYRVRVNGIPLRWRTRIIDWSPPRQFIDLQLRGPYVLWHHQHTFEPHASGGTECRDRVTYTLPGGPLGWPVHALMVRPQLLGIFRFRREAIAKYLGAVTPVQGDVEIARVR